MPFDHRWAPHATMADLDTPWAEVVRQLCTVVRGADGDAEGAIPGAGLVHGPTDVRYQLSGWWDLSGPERMVRPATVSSRGDDEGRQVRGLTRRATCRGWT